MFLRWSGILAPAMVALGSFAGCEASQPKQVDNPDPLGLGAESSNADLESDEPAEGSTEATSRGAEKTASKGDDDLGGDPAFTDSMTVDEAISAVPPDADRLNIEQDILAEPLQQSDLYEPCKLGSGHFKARVAVWQGRAVGVDVETQPKNPRLAKCIDEQIRQVKWSDKVRSLNTVEYSY